jgi:hypothetical protein
VGREDAGHLLTTFRTSVHRACELAQIPRSTSALNEIDNAMKRCGLDWWSWHKTSRVTAIFGYLRSFAAKGKR